MNGIIYEKLSEQNFGEFSLDDFVRQQTATEVWLKNDGEWVLTTLDKEIVWSWNLEKRRQTAKTIFDGIRSGGFGFGAFLDGKVVGYIYITGKFWGSRNQYTELKLFHITASCRRLGIGRTLFRLACDEARSIGAEKLYISANHSKESQQAYRKLGCVYAEEINPQSVEREPFDVQMEYDLQS